MAAPNHRMEAMPETSSPSSSRGAGHRAKGLFGAARAWALASALGLTVGLAGVGYVAGRVHGWSSESTARSELQVAVAAHQRTFTRVRSEHEAQRGRLAGAVASAAQQEQVLRTNARLYEGYRRLQRARSALEDRDFGVAQDELEQAKRVLLDVPVVRARASVTKQLAQTNIMVARAYEPQRQGLSRLMGQLDTLLLDALKDARAR